MNVLFKDNTEISGTILVGRQNVVSGGETRLWKAETPKGNYKEECFKAGSMKKNLLLNYALSGSYETIIFNDRKIKHEV